MLLLIQAIDNSVVESECVGEMRKEGEENLLSLRRCKGFAYSGPRRHAPYLVLSDLSIVQGPISASKWPPICNKVRDQPISPAPAICFAAIRFGRHGHDRLFHTLVTDRQCLFENTNLSLVALRKQLLRTHRVTCIQLPEARGAWSHKYAHRAPCPNQPNPAKCNSRLSKSAKAHAVHAATWPRLRHHFTASMPSGGLVSTLPLPTSDQLVLSAVPLLSW